MFKLEVNSVSRVLVFTSFVYCVAGLCNLPANNERYIFEFLFTNSSYNKFLRPVKNLTTRTDIHLSFSLIAIVNFNEVEETITVTGILPLSWRDEFLTWNATEFGNVEHIHVPQHLIWRPFVNLENSVKKTGDLGSPFLQVELSQDGTIEWSPVETFIISCHLDLYNFPFDTQKCTFVFEAYGMHENDQMFLPGRPDLDLHEYEGTSGWVISQTIIETIDLHGQTHILCSMHLYRKPLYFVLNIFCPIILLSALNICVFLIPVDSGEKVGFAVTMFLSMIVFLTIVSSKLPENSDRISLLNIYVFVSTVLSTLIAIITLIQMRLYFRDPSKPVPMFLQKIAKLSVNLPKIRILRSTIDEPEDNSESRDNVDTNLDSHTDYNSHIELPEINLPSTSTQSPASFVSKPSAMKLHVDQSDRESDTSFTTRRSDMHLVIKNYPSRSSFIKPLDDLQRGPQSIVSLNANFTENETSDVKWPDVVKTFDKLLFVLFLLVYILFSFFTWRTAEIRFYSDVDDIKQH